MTEQLLPDFHNFTEPDPSGCPSPQLYTTLRPWSSPVTAWNIDCEVGSIADTDGGATFVPFPQAASERRMGWVCWDSIVQDDGSAEILPEFKLLAGTVDEDTANAVGVCARVQDGTWVNAGDADGYLDLPDGYFFIHSNKPGSGNRLFLLRMVSGTAFQIATKTILALDDNPMAYPRRMRIECEGNTIRCYRDQTRGHETTDYTGLPAGVTVDPSPPDDLDLVFSVVDNSPTAITTAGRYGFGLMQPYDDSGTQTVVVGKALTIKDGTGEVLVRDKFQRAYRNAQKQMVDGLSRAGRCVASAFSGDYHGCQFNPAFFRNLEQEATDDVSLGPVVNINGTNQEFGWHIFQRPATSNDQSRELHFHWNNLDASNNRVSGILLRGTFTGTIAPLVWTSGSTVGQRGYNFEVSWAQALTPQFKISIVDYSDSALGPQTLATASLPGIALGSDHVLIASVEESPAKLRAVFNGTPINSWSIPSGLLGVTTFGEYVTDARTAHHATGSMEGWHFRATTNYAGPLVWVDYFGPGPAVGDAGGPDASAMASYPVPLEDWNKTGTALEIDPGLPISVEDQREVLAQRVRSGHTNRMPMGARVRRRWRVGMSGRDAASIDALEAFYEARRGSEQPFPWVEPHGGQSVLVRFGGGFLDTIRKVRGGQSASFTLEEVFEHGA